jgi:hypothetical protein
MARTSPREPRPVNRSWTYLLRRVRGISAATDPSCASRTGSHRTSHGPPGTARTPTDSRRRNWSPHKRKDLMSNTGRVWFTKIPSASIWRKKPRRGIITIAFAGPQNLRYAPHGKSTARAHGGKNVWHGFAGRVRAGRRWLPKWMGPDNVRCRGSKTSVRNYAARLS